MNKYLFICFITTSLLFASCDRNAELRKVVQMMYGHKVIIPESKLHIVNEYQGTTKEAPFSLVVYIDSTVCSSCQVRELDKWNTFLSGKWNKSNNIRPYFIFHPSEKDMDILRFTIKSQEFSFPIYLDSIGIFEKRNRFLPTNPIFHTFLLNQQNEIVLVGSPKDNPQIFNMLKETISQQKK